MKSRLISIVLAIILAVSCISMSSLSAASLYVRKVVSVVYDDSGSMRTDNSKNWSYANYAMQTFCGLMNAEDELYITYMSKPDTAVVPNAFSTDRQAAVDNIRASIESGETPQSAIRTAQNVLVESYSANRSEDVNTEYWLVVLTDGEFNEEGVFGQSELDGILQSFAKSQKNDGMDLHTIYLAIGSNAIEATSDSNLNIVAEKCDDGAAIVSVLSELSNAVSGRYRLSQEDITLVDEKTVEVNSEIPLINIALLMQNSSADLESIVKDDGSVLQIDQKVSLKYPEKSGWTTDTSLSGQALLVRNSGQNITPGKYTLTFSGKIDIEALDIMFEPALEPQLSVLLDGKEVRDLSALKESDIIDVQMKIFESGTDKEVDVALLNGDVKYELGYKQDDIIVNSTDSTLLTGITVKDLKTVVYGSFTFGRFMPLTVSIEITPAPVNLNYELRLVLMKEGGVLPDVSVLQADDVITASAHLFDVSTGKEVDISLLEGAISTVIGYRESDKEVLSEDGTVLTDIPLKALDTEIYASFQIDDYAPVTAAVNINLFRKTAYRLLVEVPENYKFSPSELSGDIPTIRFIITGDGVPLTKEETKDQAFEISLDKTIPYSLQQNEDGSYSFRPVRGLIPLFYPAGNFTVTGTLNKTVQASGDFEITSVHLYVDALIIICPLILLGFIIYYLTQKRFPKGYIIRRIFFITDGSVREGIESSIFINRSTGWRQFFHRARTQEFANLTFAAGGRGTVFLRARSLQEKEYLLAVLSDEQSEIHKKYVIGDWKIGRDLKGNILISETNALYIRHLNNITVYYIETAYDHEKRIKSIIESSSEEEIDFEHSVPEDPDEDGSRYSKRN